ncbi:hypothetical protein Tco_0679251 [Tanacetum coccineum]|uniref:Uncharacterized protein n=1 Tax=Tanacetum coccineum TaxID=301880 RepID=A0ABQ4XI11_9ASTR
MGLLWKTNDESGTPRSQSGWKTSWAKKDDKKINVQFPVVDSSNNNQWAKRNSWITPTFHLYMCRLWTNNEESGPLSSKWLILKTTNGAKRKLDHLSFIWYMSYYGKLIDESGPLVLSLDGKLLGPRRMTKKINVHPEWKIPNTNQWAKRKQIISYFNCGKLYDESVPLNLSTDEHFLAKKDDKESSILCKNNDETGPLVLSLDGKLLGPRRMTKKINVHPEWLIPSNTKPMGKKEAGSSPPSSGKWAAVEN